MATWKTTHSDPGSTNDPDFNFVLNDDGQVKFKVNQDGTVEDANGPIMPKGAIIMWSGKGKDIPPGWALCDGSNAKDAKGNPVLDDGGSPILTPNLTGQFIIGADRGDS